MAVDREKVRLGGLIADLQNEVERLQQERDDARARVTQLETELASADATLAEYGDEYVHRNVLRRERDENERLRERVAELETALTWLADASEAYNSGYDTEDEDITSSYWAALREARAALVAADVPEQEQP